MKKTELIYLTILTLALNASVIYVTHGHSETNLTAIESIRDECIGPVAVEPDSIFVDKYEQIDTVDYGEQQ